MSKYHFNLFNSTQNFFHKKAEAMESVTGGDEWEISHGCNEATVMENTATFLCLKVLLFSFSARVDEKNLMFVNVNEHAFMYRWRCL